MVQDQIKMIEQKDVKVGREGDKKGRYTKSKIIEIKKLDAEKSFYRFKIREGLLAVLEGNFFDLIFEDFVKCLYPIVLYVSKSASFSKTAPYRTRSVYVLSNNIDLYKQDDINLIHRIAHLTCGMFPLMVSEEIELNELKYRFKAEYEDILRCRDLKNKYEKITCGWYSDFVVFTPETIDVYEFKAGKYIKFTDKQKEMFNNLKASGLPIKIIIVNSDSNFDVEYDIVTYNEKY